MYAGLIRPGVRLAAIGLAAAAAAWTGCRKPATSASPKPSASQFSPDVEEALGEIEKAWDGVTSFSAKVETDLDNAVGRVGWTKGKGTYDLEKDGDTVKICFKIGNVLSMVVDPTKVGSDRIQTAEMLTWVSDGSVMYQYTFQHQLHRVRKTWYSETAVLQLGGPPLLRELRAKRTVKRLPDDVVDGKPVFVFEAKPHNGTWTEKHVFQKATGIRAQYIETDAKGEQTYSVKVTELTLGVTFEPDHFTFEVPEYAELIDETK